MPKKSVTKPGMISSRPASASIMPPITSRPGISPCCIFCCALNRVLIPSLRTREEPSTAVSTSNPTVGKAPITEPTSIITVSSSNTKPTNNSSNLPIMTSVRVK
ncbi:hypothetical protein D3C79_801520 [compost metagenome]